MISRRAYSRRQFLRGLGATGAFTTVAPLLAACQAAAPAAPGEAAQEAGAPAAGQEAQNLIFWRNPSQPQEPVLQDLIAQYTEANPGATIEMAAFGPMAEYRQKVLASIAANTGPDFLISDGPWLPEFAARGIINPATPDVEQDVNEDFTEGGRAYVTFEGTVYGYPWETNVHQLFINTAMFEEAGLDPSNPPVNSWDEFREAVNQLAVVENGTLARAGFLVNPRLLYLADFLYINDGRVLNEDAFGNLQEPVASTLTEPPAMETWQLWNSFYNEDNAASATFPSHTDSFTQGLSAMAVSGNFFIDGLTVNAPDLAFTIAPIPTNTGNHQAILGGWMWAVMESAETGNKAAAWEFIQLANSKENLLNSLQTFSWLVTRTSVLDDPQLNDVISDPLQKFYEVLPSITHVRPKTVVYQQLEFSIDPIIQQMILGDLSPDQAAQQADEITNNLLQQEGEA